MDNNEVEVCPDPPREQVPAPEKAETNVGAREDGLSHQIADLQPPPQKRRWVLHPRGTIVLDAEGNYRGNPNIMDGNDFFIPGPRPVSRTAGSSHDAHNPLKRKADSRRLPPRILATRVLPNGRAIHLMFPINNPRLWRIDMSGRIHSPAVPVYYCNAARKWMEVRK